MSDYEQPACRDGVLAEAQKRIRETMNHRADDMLTGSCRNYPEYTKITGVIEGLALAERHLLDLDETMHVEDN